MNAAAHHTPLRTRLVKLLLLTSLLSPSSPSSPFGPLSPLSPSQATAQPTPPLTHHDIQTHTLESPHQAKPTQVRVLRPEDYVPNQKRYRVLYVLPVVAESERRFGDGLLEIKNAGLHDQHQLICVAPEFTAPPWFADHDSDPTKKDESHFLKTLLPFIDAQYATVDAASGRLLRGFSKSGWGALSLLLRHPHMFGRAAAWDCGIRIDTGPIEEADRRERIKRIWGSPENFERYRLSTLVKTRGQALGPEPRLFYYNTEGNRAAGGAALHDALVALKIPHRYLFEPKRPHRWDSGWLPTAVEFLVNSKPAANKHPLTR